ncbi:MAG TPA: hypothetical protein VGO53_01265, partial [Steroidobacteraceae bacterium]|nr:hypothetical protein [Steroidobacteraceae bacterium]
GLGGVSSLREACGGGEIAAPAVEPGPFAGGAHASPGARWALFSHSGAAVAVAAVLMDGFSGAPVVSWALPPALGVWPALGVSVEG